MKVKLLKAIVIMMTLVFLLATLALAYSFFNRSGGGFLDLTNILRYICLAVMTLSGLIGVIAHYSLRKKQMK